MLGRLSIRDIVLIDRLDIDLSDGMTVLTGETGAGKSILLDAFSLALGGRGDGGLVRSGAANGQVTAAFQVETEHPVLPLVRDAGADIDGDLILRRVQLPDGRTRAFVNDQPVSVQALRMIGQSLVEIHGQHDDRALADPATHRAMLDAFAGIAPSIAALGEKHAALRALRRERSEEEARLEAARKEADYLRHASAELSKLAPELGEEQVLSERRTLMQQSEKVASELRETSDLLSGNGSIIGQLSAAMRRLERRGGQAPQLVDEPVKAIDQALIAMDEAARAVDRAVVAADFDPSELERIEERLFALRAASRKHSVPVDKLAELAARYLADLALLDAGEANLKRLDLALAKAEKDYLDAASAVSAARKAAAERLDKAVMTELAPLKLERARFITHIVSDPGRAAAHGIDEVAFHVQTNPGTPGGPMMKVASGGELSRFMLALKVALADRGSAPTLVFDEIDTGVGGAVAAAIGQRLARLSGEVQVLSVTHAPQVAAQAQSHFLIAKQAAADGSHVVTRLTPLDRAQRREEIARMLAGETITDEARAAAETLLKPFS
jgi:DNA repair protein RecN (Recombination protein N)